MENITIETLIACAESISENYHMTMRKRAELIHELERYAIKHYAKSGVWIRISNMTQTLRPGIPDAIEDEDFQPMSDHEATVLKF